MIDIETFEKKLAALTGQPTPLRPFICDGSPLGCEVFIVGYNPATSMETDFWDYWVPGVGYDLSAWEEEYKRARGNSVTKTGKPKAALSATRKRFQWIAEEANRIGRTVRFLETNIYAFPTARKSALGPEQRNNEVFDFLLAAIKPKVLLVHGADATRHLQAFGGASDVIAVSHLYNCSECEARQYGREIRRRLQ